MRLNIDDLKQSNEFLHIVLESINSALFIVDRELRVRNFNESFQTLFGRDQAAELGPSWGEVRGCEFAVRENLECGRTSNCNRCLLRSAVLKAFVEKGTTYNERLAREFFVRGKPLQLYLQLTTRPVEFGAETMTLVVLEDITQLETQKLHLEELNHLKNRFLGIAAHDLRSPISAIQMYAAHFIDSPALPEKVRFILERTYKLCEFMMKLLDELLDISMIESGQLVLEAVPASYPEFVRQNVELHQLMANKKHIAIQLFCQPEVGLVTFDRGKIEQVLNNLISNAIKYSPPDTVITVRIGLAEGAVVTRVEDQGPGIPREEQANVFREFRRTSVKTTGGEKSTGLGLAIAKKIVEVHGGRIGLESAPGEGSTFYFSLPLNRLN